MISDKVCLHSLSLPIAKETTVQAQKVERLVQVSGLPENMANKCQSHDLNPNLLFFLSHEAGRLQRQGRVPRVVSAEL